MGVLLQIPVSGNRHLSNNNVLPSPHATRFSNLAKEDFLGDRDGLSVGELSTSSSKNSLHIHQLEGMQSQPGPSRAASGQGAGGGAGGNKSYMTGREFFA